MLDLRPAPPPAPGKLRRTVLLLGGVLMLTLAAACGPEQAGGGSPEQGGASTGPRVAGADQLEPCPVTPSRPPVTNGLPDVSLPCLGSGPDIRLADLRGPLLINVWAQWCGPCRDEAPYLAALRQRAGDKVQLLGIDYADPRPELAVKFAIEHRLTYPHLIDPEKQTRGPLRIGGPPLSVFVDKEGAVAYVHRGVFTSQQQLDQLVKDKLGVTW